MTKHTDTSKDHRSLDDRIREALQPLRGIISILSAFMLLLVGTSWKDALLPGASILLFGIAASLLTASVLLNAPPIYRRVPRPLKPASWFFFFIGSFAFLAAMGTMGSAYSRTPAGVRDAVAAQSKADADIATALSSARVDSAQAERSRAEACLSRGRRSLAQTVKENLQNPRSFEFVGIEIATVTGGKAVVFIAFRGENGFGAIRTETIRAVMDTSDCSIIDIGEQQTE